MTSPSLSEGPARTGPGANDTSSRHIGHTGPDTDPSAPGDQGTNSLDPDEPPPKASSFSQSRAVRIVVPILLFALTLCSTTAVGMRYMHNFRLGQAPLSTDADILPYTWVLANLRSFAAGLPFSLTLIAILLAHEFGHYTACRFYRIRCTLPWLLPAPSLSGTFGAVIRLQSSIRSPAALIAVGASGPIAGFLVAVVTIVLGIAWSTYSVTPVIDVQPSLLIFTLHALVHPHSNLRLIVPHPVLTASWIGVLITALNLIPAGQLDGGHIVYALSPRAHRISSRLVSASLFVCGFFFWAGWLLWALVLLLPAMRHPRVPDSRPLTRSQMALFPACLAIFLLCVTYHPFHGYSVFDVLRKLPGRNH